MDAVRRGDPEAMRILAGMSIDAFGGLESQSDASERYFAYRILRSLELSRLMAQMLAVERGTADASDERTRASRAGRADRGVQDGCWPSRSAVDWRSCAARKSSALGLELFGVEDIDFQGASPRQIAAMREAIRPLARALATKMARRRRRRDRGRLDVRRTVRRSLSTGGVLIDPAFSRPKVVRPDLFLLCDVSGSVAEFASFTLTLLQAMTAEFPGCGRSRSSTVSTR